MPEKLSALMSNHLAYQLGLIAAEVGTLGPEKCGDEIDRGLVLRRRLEEEGFTLYHDGRDASRAKQVEA